MRPPPATRAQRFARSWAFAFLTVFGLIAIGVVVGTLVLYHLAFPAKTEQQAALKPPSQQVERRESGR